MPKKPKPLPPPPKPAARASYVTDGGSSSATARAFGGAQINPITGSLRSRTGRPSLLGGV